MVSALKTVIIFYCKLVVILFLFSRRCAPDLWLISRGRRCVLKNEYLSVLSLNTRTPASSMEQKRPTRLQYFFFVILICISRRCEDSTRIRTSLYYGFWQPPAPYTLNRNQLYSPFSLNDLRDTAKKFVAAKGDVLLRNLKCDCMRRRKKWDIFCGARF
jgi:hypothetical protein